MTVLLFFLVLKHREIWLCLLICLTTSGGITERENLLEKSPSLLWHHTGVENQIAGQKHRLSEMAVLVKMQKKIHKLSANF